LISSKQQPPARRRTSECCHIIKACLNQHTFTTACVLLIPNPPCWCACSRAVAVAAAQWSLCSYQGCITMRLNSSHDCSQFCRLPSSCRAAAAAAAAAPPALLLTKTKSRPDKEPKPNPKPSQYQGLPRTDAMSNYFVIMKVCSRHSICVSCSCLDGLSTLTTGL
jgi:hypothetical protein